jgi:hypothetical protein
MGKSSKRIPSKRFRDEDGDESSYSRNVDDEEDELSEYELQDSVADKHEVQADMLLRHRSVSVGLSDMTGLVSLTSRPGMRKV